MLSSILETVESYGTWAMIGFCFAILIAALILTKYAIARPWYRFVRSTAADWDDLLFESFSKRLYSFIIIGSINLSVNWIIDADSEHIATLNPIFSASYILLSTSLASVIVKYITPAVAERFSKKSSVTVSGGNPIITNCNLVRRFESSNEGDELGFVWTFRISCCLFLNSWNRNAADNW